MGKKALLICVGLGFLLGSYSLYARLFSHFMQLEVYQGRGPSAGQDFSVPNELAVRPAAALARKVWGPKAPQANAAIMLEFREQGVTLYADEYDKVEGSDQKRWKLKPFSLISIDSKNGQVSTVQSPEAEVEFDGPVDLARLKAGRPVGGQLLGGTHLRSDRATPADASDDLVLFVSEPLSFHESTRKLLSDGAVRLLDRNNEVTGQGLVVDLKPLPEGETRPDRPAVGEAERVTLARDVKMSLVMSSGSGFLGGAPAKADEPRPGEHKAEKQSGEGMPVEISCAGPFTFDLDKNVARFEGDVRLARTNAQGQKESLSSETLELAFERRLPTQGDAPAVSAQDKMTLQRARAIGEKVVVISEPQQARAEGTELSYMASEGRTVFRGKPEVVAFLKNGSLRAPQLVILGSPDKGLQEAVASGPGRLELRDEQTKATTLTARWHDELRSGSEEELDTVLLTGEASMAEAQRGELRADRIKLWLERPAKKQGEGVKGGLKVAKAERVEPAVAANAPLSVGEPLGARAVARRGESSSAKMGRTPTRPIQPPGLLASAAPARASVAAPSGTRKTLTADKRAGQAKGQESSTDAAPASDDQNPLPRQPRRLQAWGNVRATSPQANVTAGEVEVNFEEGAPATAMSEPPAAPVVLPVVHAERSLAAARQKAPRARGSRPGLPKGMSAGNTAPPPQTHAGPPEPPQPMNLRATKVWVKAVRDGTQTTLGEAWADGAVEITQASTSADEPGTELRGSRMHVVREGTAHVVDMEGGPAYAQLQKLTVSGPRIHVDQAMNNALVEGEGFLRMPASTDFQGQKLAKPKEMEVRWKERMSFDGLKATFLGDVMGVQDSASLRAQRLAVTMSRRVSLQQTQQARSDPPAISRAECYDDVQLKSAVRTDGRLEQSQQFEAQQLSFDKDSGRITGRGPGMLHALSRGDGGPGALGLPSQRFGRPAMSKASGPGKTATAKPGSAAADDDSDQLKLTHIDFHGALEGNSREGWVTFHDSVEVVHTPLEDENQPVDADHLPAGGMWMRCEQLEVRTLRDAQGQELRQMTALGNAQVESQQYNAQADRIAFDEAKDLMVLEGDSYRPAVFWRQRGVGMPYEQLRARKIHFHPQKNQLRIFDGQGLDASELSSVESEANAPRSGPHAKPAPKKKQTHSMGPVGDKMLRSLRR